MTNKPTIGELTEALSMLLFKHHKKSLKSLGADHERGDGVRHEFMTVFELCTAVLAALGILKEVPNNISIYKVKTSNLGAIRAKADNNQHKVKYDDVVSAMVHLIIFHFGKEEMEDEMDMSGKVHESERAINIVVKLGICKKTGPTTFRGNDKFKEYYFRPMN